LKTRSRFGTQPLSEEMRRQRWHYSQLAREINVTQRQLYAAARGVVVPSPILRDRLPPILGVPLSQLFTTEALDYRYQDNHHRFDRLQQKSRKAVSS
jgi:transcriptional regulator with XRE-family HTH domain